MWKNKVVHYARTDVGIKRSHNQDALGVAIARLDSVWRRRGHLFVVADGMGAHAVGEMASKMAVQTIEHTYPRLKHDQPDQALRTAFVLANETVHEKGLQNPEFRGMGTTATALALLPEGAYIGHVGDSRCYRIRLDGIDQLTFDHSLQWELARQRHVQPEELDKIPTNVIVRSLGPQPEVKADTAGPYELLNGDRFLLCSDGLTGPVKDEELWAAVTALDGESACQFLVDLANLRGGLDNITLMLIRAGDDPKPDEKPTPLKFVTWSQRFRSLARKIPSEWWYFLGGLLTACIGGGLLYLRDWRLNAATFILALVLLGSAFFTSVRRRRHAEQKAMSGDNEQHDPTPIHRSRKCTFDAGLVESISREERRLRELAMEQGWRVAWEDLVPVHGAAEAAKEAQDYQVAFREYARAISILSIGMRHFQEKKEVLMPHWDRARK